MSHMLAVNMFVIVCWWKSGLNKASHVWNKNDFQFIELNMNFLLREMKMVGMVLESFADETNITRPMNNRIFVIFILKTLLKWDICVHTDESGWYFRQNWRDFDQLCSFGVCFLVMVKLHWSNFQYSQSLGLRLAVESAQCCWTTE